MMFRISLEAIDRRFAKECDRQFYNTFRWRADAEDWYFRVTTTQIADRFPMRVGFYCKDTPTGNWNDLSDRVIEHPARPRV